MLVLRAHRDELYTLRTRGAREAFGTGVAIVTIRGGPLRLRLHIGVSRRAYTCACVWPAKEASRALLNNPLLSTRSGYRCPSVKAGAKQGAAGPSRLHSKQTTPSQWDETRDVKLLAGNIIDVSQSCQVGSGIARPIHFPYKTESCVL